MDKEKTIELIQMTNTIDNICRQSNPYGTNSAIADWHISELKKAYDNGFNDCKKQLDLLIEPVVIYGEPLRNSSSTQNEGKKK